MTSFKDMALLDFDVQREEWLYYKLSDDSRLKFKVVLAQVAKSRSQANAADRSAYQFRIEKLSAVVSFSEALRKPPSTGNVTAKRLSKSLEEQVTCNLEADQDIWNVYHLKDGPIIKITPVIEKVVRTKLGGMVGEPTYAINSHFTVSA